MIKKELKLDNHSVSYAQSSEALDPNKMTVLFVHGNSSSKAIFKNQLEDTLLSEKYNLIAIDLPGHGDSEHIAEAETNPEIYTVPHYAQTLKSFLTNQHLNNVIAVGHSLGGHVTTALSKIFKLKALINIQNTPINTSADVANALSQDPSFQQLFNPEVTDDGLSALASHFFNDSPSPTFSDDFKKSDPNCRKNLVMSMTSGIVLDEIQYLKELNIPYKLIVGKNDPFTSTAYIKSLDFGDAVILLASFHYPMLELSQDVNNIINEY